MGTDKRARQKEMSRTRADQARRAAKARARRKVQQRGAILVVFVALALVLGVFFAGGSTKTKATTTTTSATPTSVPTIIDCPNPDGSAERKTSFKVAPTMCIDAAKTYTADVETNMGNFTLKLDAAKAPKTVNNFVVLARYHYYDGLTFHRIVKDFMIQGGDPEGTGTGGPGYKFDDELPQQGEYQKYSVAMANSGPNTNGSQFFIVTGQAGISLPPKYSLFGIATSGTDVIDKIGVVPVDGETPKEKVTIEKVTITES